MTIVLSFDIDGTLEVGDPPGGITMAMVRKAHELGFLVGSCSDQPLSWQREIWKRCGIPLAFTLGKMGLDGLAAQIPADAYYHIGDSIIDQQFAKRAGMGFWWAEEAVAEPWLLLLGLCPLSEVAP